MSFRHLFKLFVLGFFMLVLSGCAESRQPKVTQFNSGIEKSKEWNEYNTYAKSNDKPILNFAATTLEYKFKGGVLSYDDFLPEDPQVTIQTKWDNTKVSDKFEFEFYMPDGRLYEYGYFKMKKVFDKYTIGSNMYIRGLFPAKIQGKWKVKVFANEKFVMSKEFTIGIAKAYNKAETNLKIGVFPYIDDSKMSTWKHGISLSKYISWAILDGNKNVEIATTYQLRQDLGNPNITYENFKKFLDEDLTLEDSIILGAAKKHSLDYIVLGRVQSYWQSGSSNTKADTYIIDVAKKQIIDTISTTGRLGRSDYGFAHQNKVKGFHPNRIKVYKQIYKELDKKIQAIAK